MRYISILLTFLSIHCFSAETILKRSIAWEIKRIDEINFGYEFPNKKILYFKGASLNENETFLPYYTEFINIKGDPQIATINVEDQIYVSCQPEDLVDVINIQQLKNEIDYTGEIRYDRKQPVIFFRLVPLRRNAETGNVEKLVSFSIKIGELQTSQVKTNSEKTISKLNFATSSVLKTGDWYSVKIPKSGIYKLTYNELLEMGISNPENVRVYGNGGKMLSMMNADERPDDLQENAIFMEKGSDNIFNNGDYILFFAQGPVAWTYSVTENMFLHKLHDYSYFAEYFLTSSFGVGKKIENSGTIDAPANIICTDFTDHQYQEVNTFNLVGSGRQWFGEELVFEGYDTTFLFQNLEDDIPVRIKVNVMSRSSYSKTFTIKANGQSIDNITVGAVNLTNSIYEQGKQKSSISTFTTSNDNITIEIVYNKTLSTDRGFIDYIDINANRRLQLTGDPLIFRNPETIGPEMITEFRIENGDNQTIVWDISDIYNIKKMNISVLNPGISFKSETNELKEFAAFTKSSSFLTPVYAKGLNKVENQDLHAVQSQNMIIVTNPLFIQQAEKLAEFHRQQDNLSVYVATTNKIYNEFSAGIRDISAIRDFVKMVYDRSGSGDNALKYLLLFGDGSYNNILDNELNPNLIPTYQSVSSLIYSTSYVSDDFFGFLDDNEGGGDAMDSYILDVGIGRLPVKDTSEATDMVNKIISYSESENMLDWRNLLLFLGDDNELESSHNLYMEQANTLGDIIMNNYPQFGVKKILLDAYKRSSTASGNRYPEAHRSIIDNLNKGILLLNYTGHGGENGITTERVLVKDDIIGLRNKYLPLFITATCEFSRFDYIARNEKGDYIEENTAGEAAILNPRGGAIGLITTTRLVYGIQNYSLNLKIFDYIFRKDEYGRRPGLGDVLRSSKIALGDDSNKLNFVLLGDPALKLAIPNWYVVTDSMNGKSIHEDLDTLKAFSKITITGHIVNNDSIQDENFNGTIYPSVFDKRQLVTTLSNTGKETMDFYVQENLIYHGKATVKNGRFTFSFIVPKDISYQIGEGKITYYAENSMVDANGYYSGILIGGTSDTSIVDNTGPEINLYLNDENFRSGGITDKNPLVYATVNDENGINTTGNGIGHDIVGILDGDNSNPLRLNEYFQYEIDDYRNGKVLYQLVDLEPGKHTLEVKVWDILNNSSVASIEFFVKENDKFLIENLINYPNPMGDYTYFQFEHNMPDTEQEVSIDIFDLSGRTIRTLSIQMSATGYRSDPIEWDGKDMYGNPVQDGIYIYRLKVKTIEGNITERFEKLIILK